MIYRFADFELRPERYELLRSGETVALEPRVLEVLAYLVEHRDRTVAKSELLDTLWEADFVSESALTRTIRELRKALADSAAEPRFIKTVYGRGYLFVAEVEEATEAAARAAGVTASPSTSGAAPRAPASPALEATRAAPFVGRAVEMAHLTAALDAAIADRGGRLVLLAGDPGIGKTRTAQALAAEAEGRGALALWGKSLEGLRAPPYWPWIQAIRAYLERVEAGRLRAEMGAGAADVAEIVAEVRERLPELPPAPAVEDPDHARFRLFDSVAGFLRRAAQARPLLLVLDNLHWADRPSLRLLEFLAQELQRSRILVVGTYREIELSRQHSLSDTLGELGREGLFERIPLGGLSREEVARYLAEVTPAVPPSLARMVHRQTEGNPFFVAEVVRLLAQQGLLSPEAVRRSERGGAPLVLSIPEGVREVVGRRLNRLSDGCNAVLTVAAVIGRGFGLRELERAVDDPPPERLGGLLEEAEAAGLIEEIPGTPGGYQFTHALIRETLADELSTPRRARLHRRIGETLEELHAGDLGPWMSQLAHHFFEGSLAGTAEKAVDYCVRAARLAVEVMANEEAAWLLERALEALDLTHPVDEQRLCRLRLECGRALARGNQPARALEMFQRAAEAARRLGSPEVFAEAALGMGGHDPGTAFGLHAEPALRLLEEALAILPAGDSALRVRLLCGMAGASYVLARLEEGAAASAEALAMARRLGDARSVVGALRASLAGVLDVPSREAAREHLGKIDEMFSLAEELGDTFALTLAHGFRTDLLLSCGDVEGFRAEVARYGELGARLRQPIYRCLEPMHEAALATLEGRFADAEAAIRQSYKAGRRVHFPNIEGIFSSQMFTLRRLEGRLEEIAPAADRFVGTRAASEIWGPGAAVLFVELGRPDQARAALDRQAALGFDTLPRDVMLQTSLCHFAEAASALGDRAHARQIYDLLAPTSGSSAVRGGGSVCIGSVDHYLGDLAATLELVPEAHLHFERALEMNGAMGARPWQALTEERFARFLAAASDDAERARRLAGRALATAEELGMRTLAGRARATLEELGGDRPSPAPSPAAPDHLTLRELDVLRLLARGMSNREIGAELSISAHTVTSHVRSILAKTGSANRAEAAAYAVRNGLTDDG